MKINKIKQQLGLSQRARKCIDGDELLSAISSRKVSIVLLATDASERTKKMYQTKCNSHKVPLYEILTRDDLSHAIGKVNRVALGIADSGFGKLITQSIEE